MSRTASSTLSPDSGSRNRKPETGNFFSFWLLAFWLLASGCGFHAVYAKTEENDQILDKLAEIQVEPILNHDLGQRHYQQILQNDLGKFLNPSSAPGGNPVYTLKITLTLAERSLGTQNDLRVTRYDVIGSAMYQLVELGTNREVDHGTVTTKSSYNRTVSEFSTFVSDQNANELAARELAQLLKERLIYHFSEVK